ncbi:hypothetical protein VP01_188g1 [Puccinia sorghi]|uniref:Uncharacterized protein n=1 Tax=Puccinia sorghi TaxID=27349 RepID=A0A0L6VD08_9BASI|nr:hypothetical protein VP01_188g1 [Puccinia sorghi]
MSAYRAARVHRPSLVSPVKALWGFINLRVSETSSGPAADEPTHHPASAGTHPGKIEGFAHPHVNNTTGVPRSRTQYLSQFKLVSLHVPSSLVFCTFQHLSIKLVSRYHKGSLLADPIVNLLIKCFCNKMELVVNSGLNKLGLAAPPPPKLKKTFLVFFPYSNTLKPVAEKMGRDQITILMREKRIWMMMILERSKKKMVMIPIFVQVKHPAKRRLKISSTNRNKSNKLYELTQMCQYFTVGIRCEKDHWLCCLLEPVISGYGIHWNIKYEINNAREVSHSLKKLNQAIVYSCKQNCKVLGHSKEIWFTQANWIQIKRLNNEWKVSKTSNLIHITDHIAMSAFQFVLQRKLRVMKLLVPFTHTKREAICADCHAVTSV